MPPLHRVSRLGFVNYYLVEEEDGLTVVDTMIPRCEKRILAAAEEVGRPIVRIVLTHAHMDHIGSLDGLAALVPDAEVSISARDARLMAGDMSLDPDEPDDKLRGGYPGGGHAARPDARRRRPRRLAGGRSRAGAHARAGGPA
jgi:glyoxylase-like metal-dependent hydrolase (beta-lactamase superfamily II)